MVKLKNRYSGVLMSISSLPSDFGIGGFGKECHEFLHFLKKCGFSALQVLPFNLPDFGNSPYGSVSAFAGNYLYIDPVSLYNDGLLTDADIEKLKYKGSPFTADYEFVYNSKKQMLKTALKNADAKLLAEVEDFLKENSWAFDYALYMSIKDKNNGQPFSDWPKDERDYSQAFLKADDFKEQITYYGFEQYIFAKQYAVVKKQAEAEGIAIIGDIPIYVAADSVDVWKNPHLFKLDKDYKPKEVAGVPPDAFSADGQLWGNPIYDWEAHEKEGFAWWLSRLERTFQLYDTVRIDHFRGFASYYSIKAGEKDAKGGKWNDGPSMKLFGKVIEKFDKDRIIAEDLGTYGEDVVALLRDSGIKGMRVIQFGFSGGESTHQPHNYSKDCIAYLGTHDNNTLLGWLWDISERERKFVLDYCSFKGSDWGEGGYFSPSCRAIIETVFKSSATAAIIPFQDLCGFGKDARMNIPGVPKDNWRYRTDFATINRVDTEYYKKINELYFR